MTWSEIESNISYLASECGELHADNDGGEEGVDRDPQAELKVWQYGASVDRSAYLRAVVVEARQASSDYVEVLGLVRHPFPAFLAPSPVAFNCAAQAAAARGSIPHESAGYLPVEDIQ